MFEHFQEFNITVQNEPKIILHGRHSAPGSLPPLLLVHGFPQSHHIWHRVAPKLLDRYSLIIPDLRGYGASSKPENVEAYAKSVMAQDLISLMQQLGHERFYVCGHDRGARVAHKLCVDHPENVRKVIFLDICPTLAMYQKADWTFANAYFHWFFLVQPHPLPEASMVANPDLFAGKFLAHTDENDFEIFGKDNFNYYKKLIGDMETAHGMCQDYRAAATLDIDEQKDDAQKGRKIKCPVRVLWGKQGLIEKLYDPVQLWKDVTDQGVSVDGFRVESGHYIPEQVPAELVKYMTEFFQ